MKIPWLVTKVSLRRRRTYGTIRLSRCAAGKKTISSATSLGQIHQRTMAVLKSQKKKILHDQLEVLRCLSTVSTKSICNLANYHGNIEMVNNEMAVEIEQYGIFYTISPVNQQMIV